MMRIVFAFALALLLPLGCGKGGDGGGKKGGEDKGSDKKTEAASDKKPSTGEQTPASPGGETSGSPGSEPGTPAPGEGPGKSPSEGPSEGPGEGPPATPADEVTQEEIRNHVEKLSDPDEAENAAVALERIGKPAIPALVKALEGDDPRVSFYAVVVLGTIGDPEVIEPLIESLKHDASFVRKAASQSLSDITNQDWGTDYEKWKTWNEERG